jgi:hypothetical protein
MSLLQDIDKADEASCGGPAHRILVGEWDDPREAVLRYDFEDFGARPVALFTAGQIGYVLEEKLRAGADSTYTMYATRLPFCSAPLDELTSTSDKGMVRLLLSVAPILFDGIKRPKLNAPCFKEAKT